MPGTTNSARAVSRRRFLMNSSLSVSSAVAVTGFPHILSGAQADTPPIRVGIIGCGGRGTGAGRQAETAAPNVKVVAIADVFEDRLQRVKQSYPDVKNYFPGLDGYRKLLDMQEINYVILAAPPGFRPLHFAAAIDAGKHVFMEKPVATDAPGIRTILAAGDKATEKKLCVVAGIQRRYASDYLEAIQKIRDGAIGEITYMRCYWNTGAIWHRGDAGETDMEKQIRNWYHYTWLSGDHIVEQHIHNIDVCNWAANAHPLRAAFGLGGRQGLGEKSGHIFDHFAVEFEYPNGLRMFSQCRQINGCDSQNGEYIHGTKGVAQLRQGGRVPCQIQFRDGPAWVAGKPNDSMVQEHAVLVNAIRTGKYINATRDVTESTLTAIMGRESTYSGKAIEWNYMLNCQKRLVPEKLEWGPAPQVKVAVPGTYTSC